MVLIPMALGTVRRLLGLEGGSWKRMVEPLEPLERLLRFEPWCAWLDGAAVQGLCNGECGEALTGRKYCCSLLGLGALSRSIGGVASRAELVMRGELGRELEIKAGWMPSDGEKVFSGSEQ
jgi:hypothetical protein